VVPASGDGAKRARLLEFLWRYQGTGIIYASTVKAVEELSAYLQSQGADVAAYHGRMALKRRTEAQDRFMNGQVRALVATNAFGLGIDKADIRFVVHYHLPGTIEAFYQEFGRAGRDGQLAQGVLLYDPRDRKLQRFFQSGRHSDEDLVNAYHALQRFAGQPAPTLGALEAISPLSRARLKASLAIFIARGILRRETNNRYRLLRPDLTRDQVARVGETYKDHQERDHLKLQEMIGYAEGHSCRWKRLIDYFGSEELPDGQCGHCGLCQLVAKHRVDTKDPAALADSGPMRMTG